jgi:hypothetical protein
MCPQESVMSAADDLLMEFREKLKLVRQAVIS